MFVPRELIHGYSQLFVNQTAVWRKQVFTKAGFQYVEVSVENSERYEWAAYEPLSDAVIVRHLKGEVTVSLMAHTEDFHTKWLAFDMDGECCALDALETELISWGMFPLREGKRDGKEGHLWVLLDAAVPCAHAIRFGVEARRRSGVAELLSKGGLKEKDLEFFPKYVGGKSSLRAPLGIHRKPGANECRGWFEGPPRNVLEQLRWLLDQPLSPSRVVVQTANLLFDKDESSRIERTKPMRVRSEPSGLTNILDYVEVTSRGSKKRSQCPACALEGGDSHRDNLSIFADGFGFKCWNNHTTAEVIRAVRR